MSSKTVDVVETVSSTTDDNDNLDVKSELPSVVIDAINKEQPVLPYSQKALETLK